MTKMWIRVALAACPPVSCLRRSKKDTGGQAASATHRFGSAGLLLLTLAVASIARADGEADTATVYLADGTRQVGVVRSISPSELVIGRDSALRLATADVVRLEFPIHVRRLRGLH